MSKTRSRALALASFVAAGGCAITTYRPTEPRPAIGPGIQIDIMSIRGPARTAEVSIRTQQPTLIGPVSSSTGDNESCSSTRPLVAARPAPSDVTLPETFEVAGADVVLVDLGANSQILQSGLFLDFKVDTSADQGCLRTPLTAVGGETLWRAERRPWSLSAGFRFDDPLSSLEGTGARLSLGFRALVPVGPVRFLYGFMLGGASCRGGDCPPFEWYGGDEESGISGLFGHVGGEIGIERRFPLGRWAMALAVGGSIAAFHLGGTPDYLGERNAGVAGPFASLTLFVPRSEIVPGFAPPARRGTHGPELFLQRATAFGRGPTESAWVVGLGWRIEGTQ